MNEGQDFPAWLASTSVQREALFTYAKSEMPDDPVLISGDIDKAIRAEYAAGMQLVDCDFFLTGETAKAALAVREEPKNADLSAKERDILVKVSVRDIVRLRDSLELTKGIFAARRISGFGARKAMEK
jgi:hypothetical protein